MVDYQDFGQGKKLVCGLYHGDPNISAPLLQNNTGTVVNSMTYLNNILVIKI